MAVKYPDLALRDAGGRDDRVMTRSPDTDEPSTTTALGWPSTQNVSSPATVMPAGRTAAPTVGHPPTPAPDRELGTPRSALDLMSLVRAMGRYWIATALVLLATFGGAGAALVLVPPQYEASASYLLVRPPAPPTAADIARDPTLAIVKWDNPYVRYGNDSVILEVVARRVSGEQTRGDVVRGGGDDRYEVTLSRMFGSNSVVVVTSKASSQTSALATLRLVGDATAEVLDGVQAAEDVDPSYRFTVRAIETPDTARRIIAGTLRTMVAIVAIGAITLVVLLAALVTAADRRRHGGPQRTRARFKGGRRSGGPPIEDPST